MRVELMCISEESECIFVPYDYENFSTPIYLKFLISKHINDKNKDLK
ncbi:hypothetical protein [Clostridium beijerinckii]|uniref:Uncharacterized protein n=1 Tax=Clostridium beijerinckii TaxID=1520 RepID=A0AAE2UZ77_CLOBE|nr:hypothetical protein [Clostridium beijerinckii]MBF7810550.1 hypothetical protein [Clostridium beijerinckii]NOW91259.1 hypothetical protein [Clostridium beijerinckii]NRT23822.1 hypothetical protein [Clostridium beijerinckii]NRT68596.1 hypothetical protein [Clostridium beijerinckii]NRT86184.1 hypothetical protein [Clostridium beijerinckii]